MTSTNDSAPGCSDVMTSAHSDDISTADDWPNSPEQWPSLYREATTMTVGSIAVFVLSDLRRLAREGQLQDNQVVLNLPIRGPDIVNIWRENKEALKRRIRTDEYNTLEYLMEQYLEEHKSSKQLIQADCHFVGDENASQECVYAIYTNSVRKTITVTFRGSITLNDWFQDAKMMFGDIPNPLHDPDRPDGDQTETLALHLGFRNYLYGDAPSMLPAQLRKLGEELPKVPVPFLKGAEDDADADEDPSEKRKIDIILDQISSLYEGRHDYKLYITGHSLGGALALITSMEAAVKVRREGLPPVTCITIGNPMAGSRQFRSVVHTLEMERKLRILGVHKMDDLVPLLPDRLCTCSLQSFCHVGMQLRLGSNGTHEIRYHGLKEKSVWAELGHKARHFLLILPCLVKSRHFYRSYLDALVARRKELSRLSLNDYYDLEIYDAELQKASPTDTG